MVRYGQAASEEVRQQLLAKEDIRSILTGNGSFLPTSVVDELILAIERLIDAKIADRRTY